MVFNWNAGIKNTNSDKPRLFDGKATGFGLADYYLAKPNSQQKF